jgi:hypothetical protein
LLELPFPEFIDLEDERFLHLFSELDCFITILELRLVLLVVVLPDLLITEALLLLELLFVELLELEFCFEHFVVVSLIDEVVVFEFFSLDRVE